MDVPILWKYPDLSRIILAKKYIFNLSQVAACLLWSNKINAIFNLTIIRLLTNEDQINIITYSSAISFCQCYVC
jgi:hypothetical protein